MEQEDHTRKEVVKQLIHQFETHPNREALKADLRQTHAYNPFSEKSKDMIHCMENVEYFEMCEILPKIQCPQCLTYWTTRVLFCACGTRLCLTGKYIIDSTIRDEDRPNSLRASWEHAAHTAAKQAKKNGYDSILTRFQNCPINRESQLAIGWSEAFCAHYDEISKEDHTYVCTAEELKHT